MQPRKKIYANIICDAAGKPFKMIVSSGGDTQEYPINNCTLKRAKQAAKSVFGVTDLFISLIQDDDLELPGGDAH